jgi:hypothetical protein
VVKLAAISVPNDVMTDSPTTTMGAFVSQKTPFFSVILLVLSCVAASAAVPRDMIGIWRWQQSTIEVTECQLDSICAKVIAGPKNVGKKFFASKLVAREGDLFAQVADPKTEEIYNTRFQRIGPDTWHLDGCTAARVCLSGEFVRVK